MNTEAQGIVIGVNGTEGSSAAIREGVLEAKRTGSAVRLVHVVPNCLPTSPFLLDLPTMLTEAGRQLLDEARRTAESMAPGLVVEADLLHGSRARELARSANGARALYVGSDNRIGIDHLFRGDVCAGVVARATCPVMVARVEPAGEPHDTILVGVKASSHSAELLAAAFAAADERGSSLIVLHAWMLPSAYADLGTSGPALEEWTRYATEETESLLKDWRTGYPDVEVELRIVHAEAAQALVSASEEADLLVVVRRSHGVPAAMHLGGVAHALLRAARCPVLVVPPGDVAALPGLVVERAGALRP
ncbi:universal stress protein [Nocardioides jensenii]|uniref:universal stress protein n=1 Tax=Nocardioides jensenii TaxID=1843 RepID=UPI00082D568D|nr:universal stress protein [Nocardioides jensenii]